MKFPKIADVARELRLISANVDCSDSPDEGCEVRLQVYSDGEWVVRYGAPDYDPDHHGYWGAGTVPGVVRGKVKRFGAVALARDLLSQCREAHAMDSGDES